MAILTQLYCKKGWDVHTSGRSFSWFANSCRYSDADVYLGLAPGIEVEHLKQQSGELFYQFTERTLPISKHNGGKEVIPLRVCALRDPSLCSVERTGMPGDLEGFERVRLTFSPRANGHSGNGATNGHSHLIHPVPPVIAFLLTIGLPFEQEKHFFNGVVSEFLDQSWASFPKLLREVGCAEPSKSN